MEFVSVFWSKVTRRTDVVQVVFKKAIIGIVILVSGLLGSDSVEAQLAPERQVPPAGPVNEGEQAPGPRRTTCEDAFLYSYAFCGWSSSTSNCLEWLEFLFLRCNREQLCGRQGNVVSLYTLEGLWQHACDTKEKVAQNAEYCLYLTLGVFRFCSVNQATHDAQVE